MPSSQCSHCGSTDIDHDPARGDSVCMQCGAVLEESIIVSEVQYAQDSSGSTRAVGQLVSAEGAIPSGFSLGRSYGLGKESRMVTLENARRNISRLATQLKLPDRCIDIAHNFYKMALMRKMTQGRKNPHVVAACVYMVCRKEETPHMLLDLSDILQVNVYELGRTYLKLSTALCINTPAIDPSLYILRFAHQLEFGPKTHDVSITAARLVQRMKRDWMHTGRRPSGLCGAALLVAARLHNFNRSVDQVIKVVRVCQATVRKRLTEFGETPSSRLTLDEFMTIDLEEEQDPPSFKAARKKKALEMESEYEIQQATKQVPKFQNVIEKALEEAKQKKFARYAKYTSTDKSLLGTGVNDGSITDQFIVNNALESIDDVLKGDVIQASKNPELEKLLTPLSGTSTDSGYPSSSTSINFSDSIPDSENPLANSNQDEICPLDITGLDDAELDAYIMDDEETKTKTEFWFLTNEDYLLQRREKEKKMQEEAENSNKEHKKKRKRTRSKIQATSTDEAISRMLQQKKISLKLDYSVLENLNSDSKVPGDPDSNTAVDSTDPEIVNPKPAKRVRAPKPKPQLAPLPQTIRQGISDLIGNANRRNAAPVESTAPKSEDTSKTVSDTVAKSSVPDELKVVELSKTAANNESNIQDEEMDDEEFDEEEDEPENFNRHLSAAQLLSRQRGEEESEYCDYDYDYEEYY